LPNGSRLLPAKQKLVGRKTEELKEGHLLLEQTPDMPLAIGLTD